MTVSPSKRVQLFLSNCLPPPPPPTKTIEVGILLSTLHFYCVIVFVICCFPFVLPLTEENFDLQMTL